MIEAGLQFEERSKDAVIAAFLSLPGDLRPGSFSASEGPARSRDQVSDRPRFERFVAQNPAGFFLNGAGVTFSLHFASGAPIECHCFLEVAPDSAIAFMQHMGSAKPTYGFACPPAEREWRNRVHATFGINHVEWWLGRDSARYVPGLFWVTFVSETLARRQGLDLASLPNVGLVRCREGSLVRLYDDPAHWQEERDRVDAMCFDHPGVFSIRRIEQEIRAVKGLADIDALCAHWP